MLLSVHGAAATDVKAGDPAPLFTARTQDGAAFDLAQRKGKWTVLYFHPKAGTPDAASRRMGFATRSRSSAIRAVAFGVSTDAVESQAQFHKDENLSFDLRADPDRSVAELYGAKRPALTIAKRWTFIIDPSLTVREVERHVDPFADAQRVAGTIARLKSGAPPPPRSR